jgi:transposase
MLGRKTMEVELLRDALSKAGPKKQISRPILLPKDGGR